jgi:hypothetical protein
MAFRRKIPLEAHFAIGPRLFGLGWRKSSILRFIKR